jgi:hypothetical protein
LPAAQLGGTIGVAERDGTFEPILQHPRHRERGLGVLLEQRQVDSWQRRDLADRHGADVVE